jgi:hypothetical protein
MDYIELLEKYMQGLTTPEEEKALLDWIQHDGDARSTISMKSDGKKHRIPVSLPNCNIRC